MLNLVFQKLFSVLMPHIFVYGEHRALCILLEEYLLNLFISRQTALIAELSVKLFKIPQRDHHLPEIKTGMTHLFDLGRQVVSYIAYALSRK